MSTHLRAEDSQLINDLHRLSKTSPKLVRSTVYSAPSDPSISAMNEFKYYEIPSPFPTLARDDSKGQKKYQVVARGYDKFFNIGEVPWTDGIRSQWLHTGPRYTLSLKSNGLPHFSFEADRHFQTCTGTDARGLINTLQGRTSVAREALGRKGQN
ncbi:hypothetical protein BDR03DRAFT_980872 [Suillus americanus]|nr:hypothetical protein BDR03DRAFT_980872 [Suillus americanus]